MGSNPTLSAILLQLPRSEGRLSHRPGDCARRPNVVAAGFRQDVVLSCNLLRHINSVGFGLAHQVDSIRYALVLLGSIKLARWPTMLMFTATSHNPPPALFRTALVRTRLTEPRGARYRPVAEHD